MRRIDSGISLDISSATSQTLQSGVYVEFQSDLTSVFYVKVDYTEFTIFGVEWFSMRGIYDSACNTLFFVSCF